ncbi:DUF6766 family protein [Kribbella lupini]|uniref:Uncharacterized protein n=1 Tax=Kribbella lupini TaxID=291602 RepID=A0ABN2AJR3_9ACTN
MKRLRSHSLSLGFGALFLGALIGQAFAGLADFNNQQVAEGLATVSLGHYVTSADFAVDVTENWQSEYLQFFLYVVLTVWWVQRGSPESKQLDERGRESDEKQKVGKYAQSDSPQWVKAGGWRTRIYSSSLGLLMVTVFLACWLVQSVAGWSTYNEQQLEQLQDPLSWLSYLGSADFWSRSLQNWQSEFLAVGSMAVFSIYLRQRGSPESKPVGTSHESTGIAG